MGGIFLFVSTAAIDTGRTFKHLHNWCASSFFVFTILSCLYNTYICYVLYSKTGKIGRISMYVKIVFVVAFVVQLVLGSQAGFYENFWEYMAVRSDLGIALEYTLAFTILGYILSMSYDLKNFKYIYRNKNN